MAITRNYRANCLQWTHSNLFKAKLDAFSFYVYSYLTSCADNDGKAWPKQSKIADECGISERQVRRSVERLIEEKLIAIIEQSGSRGGRRTIYYLATRNEWIASSLSNTSSQPDCQSGSEAPNRTIGPVQPDYWSGSLYKGTNPLNLIQEKAIPPFSSLKSPDCSPKRSAKKKPSDPKQFLVLFPDEFRHDDDFVSAWDGWGQNRTEAKNPINERAAKIAVGKLTKYPVKIAVEALERSTMNGWTGVFPESIGSGGNSGKLSEASSAQPPQDFGF